MATSTAISSTLAAMGSPTPPKDADEAIKKLQAARPALRALAGWLRKQIATVCGTLVLGKTGLRKLRNEADESTKVADKTKNASTK